MIGFEFVNGIAYVVAAGLFGKYPQRCRAGSKVDGGGFSTGDGMFNARSRLS